MGPEYVPFIYHFWTFLYVLKNDVYRAVAVTAWEIMEFECFQWKTGDIYIYIYISVILDRERSHVPRESWCPVLKKKKYVCSFGLIYQDKTRQAMVKELKNKPWFQKELKY